LGDKLLEASLACPAGKEGEIMEKYEGSKWSEIEVEEEIYRIIEQIAKIKHS